MTVTGTAAGIALLFFLRGILVPLVLAFVLAVLVEALVRFIGKWAPRIPHWAVLLLSALVVITSASAAAFVIVRGIASMIHQAPQLIDRIEDLVQQAGRALHLKKPLHLATLTGDVSVPQLAGNLLGSAGGMFSSLILMITYFGFILAGHARVTRKIAKLSKTAAGRESLRSAVENISTDIETYLWVQSVTGVMISGASALVMFAVGLQNAGFWTILLFILCYIPMVGVTVGSILPALFALLQFPSWWQAAVVFGGIQLAATIVGNMIYPRLQAQTQNIDPVATLFALAFWGFLWGLTGAFLAVPLTLMVMMACAYFDRTRWVAVLLSNDGEPNVPKTSSKPV
jgi:predicted PurR-regulated permease PerM